MISTLKVEIVKVNVRTGDAVKIDDYVAEEKALHIFLNRMPLVTIFCSPSNLKELALGHVLAERILKSKDEIEEVDLKEEECICEITVKPDVKLSSRLKLSQNLSRVIFSACGGKTAYQRISRLNKLRSSLNVDAQTILSCVNRLNFIAETFRKTGGVHVAAIFRGDGTLVTYAEDVGRHNAVDKVIGSGVLQDIDFDNCFLAQSGRLTGDIVAKAARMGIPIVASLAAAIQSGIAIAIDSNLTLIGFVRGDRMNVYTHFERILPAKK